MHNRNNNDHLANVDKLKRILLGHQSGISQAAQSQLRMMLAFLEHAYEHNDLNSAKLSLLQGKVIPPTHAKEQAQAIESELKQESEILAKAKKEIPQLLLVNENMVKPEQVAASPKTYQKAYQEILAELDSATLANKALYEQAKKVREGHQAPEQKPTSGKPRFGSSSGS